LDPSPHHAAFQGYRTFPSGALQFREYSTVEKSYLTYPQTSSSSTSLSHPAFSILSGDVNPRRRKSLKVLIAILNEIGFAKRIEAMNHLNLSPGLFKFNPNSSEKLGIPSGISSTF